MAIQLLHQEIDIVPGRKPQKDIKPEGFVGFGTTILRLKNETDRQNAYTIRVRCDAVYWQDGWVQISALPPAPGGENQPPTGKPDQQGPKGQSLTIYVNQGGTRDVVISFFAPQKPESRAGVYPIRVLVETRILQDDPRTKVKERITESPALAVIRPFFKWRYEYVPESRKAGFFRKSRDFELQIHNEGNDWLYCDIKPPKPQELIVESHALRVNLPPPEPTGVSLRHIPLRAISRQRQFRGDRRVLPIPVTVSRVEAPTVPPLPEDAVYGIGGLNVGAAVVHQDTAEIVSPDPSGSLLYQPLIPATVSGFFKAVAQNIKGLVFFFIGLFFFWNFAAFAFERYYHDVTDFKVLDAYPKDKNRVRVQGKWLVGSKIYLYDATQKGEPKKIDELKLIVPKDAGMIRKSEFYITLDREGLYQEGIYRVRLGAQRLGKLTLLNMFLPTHIDRQLVDIGPPPKKAVEQKAPSVNMPQSTSPGAELEIPGSGFGETPGKVFFASEQAKVLEWKPDHITIRVPEGLELGAACTINAWIGESNFPIGSILIKDPNALNSSTTGGSSGSTSGGPASGGSGEGSTTGSLPSTSGGSSGGSSGGTSAGNSGETTASKGLSPNAKVAYSKLLSFKGSDLKAVIRMARQSPDDVVLAALGAFALAEQEDSARAEEVLATLEARLDSGNPLQIAIYKTAKARVMQENGADNADAMYSEAINAAPNVEGRFVALPDLAYIRYLRVEAEKSQSSRMLSTAKNKLEALKDRGQLRESEKKAIQLVEKELDSAKARLNQE